MTRPARGQSFIAETVASHESQIELVRRACDAGYYVHLIVVAVPEEYSVDVSVCASPPVATTFPRRRSGSRWQRLWDNASR